MPEPLPIPEDLIALQRAYDDADDACHQYVAEIDTAIELSAGTGEDPLVRPEWTNEQHVELERLRTVRRRAVMDMHRHPTMVQARTDGCSQQTETARRTAARILPATSR
jgi:hypothetical protein